MKTIRFSVAGDNNLADINEILSAQGALNSEFLDSKIAYQDQKVVNLVTFNLYDDATVPKELILRKKGENPPQNVTKFWEGIMVAGGNLIVAVAYRAK